MKVYVRALTALNLLFNLESLTLRSSAAGERVAGVQREGERDTLTPQTMRENLDRILQFMAAKRIRMTHITSKEVAEGNLKSIMRVILALAAHYKPQSVKAASPHQQEPPPAALACAPAKHTATHGRSLFSCSVRLPGHAGRTEAPLRCFDENF